jgi:hypothetical protein
MLTLWTFQEISFNKQCWLELRYRFSQTLLRVASPTSKSIQLDITLKGILEKQTAGGVRKTIIYKRLTSNSMIFDLSDWCRNITCWVAIYFFIWKTFQRCRNVIIINIASKNKKQKTKIYVNFFCELSKHRTIDIFFSWKMYRLEKKGLFFTEIF